MKRRNFLISMFFAPIFLRLGGNTHIRNTKLPKLNSITFYKPGDCVIYLNNGLKYNVENPDSELYTQTHIDRFCFTEYNTKNKIYVEIPGYHS